MEPGPTFLEDLNGETTTVELKLVNEIIECLPAGRTVFHYGKHGYAPMLLSYLIGSKTPISKLRHSVYSKLIQTPLMKQVLATSGNGVLEHAQISNAYWQNTLPFVLTLDVFHGAMQTSRPGVNLVLQLNFSSQHDRAFVNLAKPGKEPIMRSEYHPVMMPGQRELFRETLAWSRIDLDFANNEALIEEIQSDWVREAARLMRWLRHCRRCNRSLPKSFALAGALDHIEEYLDSVLAPYATIWQEAVLSAAIDFIYRELGINTIYYHSHKTGCIVKRIDYYLPPRSLYSQLPRKFCFSATSEAPAFLQANKGFRRRYKKVRYPKWYRMDIQPVLS